MELVPFAQGAAGAPGKVKKRYKLQAASVKLRPQLESRIKKC